MYINCHSHFSFRYGIMSVTDLLKLAQEDEQTALCLTDINNTSACINFIREAKTYQIKPIVGIDFRNGVNQEFVSLAKNNQGFHQLNDFLSHHLYAKKAFPERPPVIDDTIIIYPFAKFQRHFIALQPNEYLGIRIDELNQLRLSPWHNFQEKIVLQQTLTFRNKRDFNMHRLLRAIDTNSLLAKLNSSELASSKQCFLEKKELEQMLSAYPNIIQNTQLIIDMCEIDFHFKEGQRSGKVNHNKQTFTNNISQDQQLIRQECEKGLLYRYPDPKRQEEVRPRLEKELKLIIDQQFTAYFLVNWDMLRFARSQNFFYVGRGSGANSIVAYLLQITDVDPVELDLYFERFINPYRENPPDFDIDFSWKDRDIVIDYLFKKYSANKQIALVATYNTFTIKSLIRELGKVFGLATKEIEELFLERKSKETKDDYSKLIYRYARYMEGTPSHLSIHAGGILISEKPIHYYAATSMPPKGYPLIQLDMIHAEDAGLYKYDVLSQRGLGKIKDTANMVRSSGKEPDLDLHQTHRFFEDEKVKTLLRKGDTMGCFYVESPAMRMLLKKLNADNYLALVAASSIIRPGVAKSGMMREYILRSQSNNEDWKLTTPKIMQELMEETYGVMVYQEDVIKVAHYFAKLTLGEADMLRRGMSGKFRSRTEFEKVKQKFFDNCIEQGYSNELTAEVWRQIESFAGYAFSKGHSASYAVESYQSLYLKAHYPMEFIVGVINNGGGFYRTEMYLQEARKLGAIIELPDLNKGDLLCELKEERIIYMGFSLVNDLEMNVIARCIEERKRNGDYLSLSDFISRCTISIEQLSILIKAEAFRFTQKTKQELLWEMHQLMTKQNEMSVVNHLFQVTPRHYELPQLDEVQHELVFDQMELFGFPLCSPFSLIKDKLPENIILVKKMKSFLGAKITMLGYLITIKNTRTSKRQQMHFGTFVDEEGEWIDTVHFPQVAQKYTFRGRGCYLLYGKVVEEFGYATLEIEQMKKLDYIERD